MRRKGWLLAFAFVVAGCSDPATSRLAPGTKAALIDREIPRVPISLDYTGLDYVTQGTEVVVIEDPGKGEKERNVRITIKDGVEAGKNASVERHRIIPR